MTDKDIIAAFRQWTQAIAKHDKASADANRLATEHQRAAQVANDASAYAVRCQHAFTELAKRGSKVTIAVAPSQVVEPAVMKSMEAEIVKMKESPSSPPINAPVPTLSKPKAKG